MAIRLRAARHTLSVSINNNGCRWCCSSSSFGKPSAIINLILLFLLQYLCTCRHFACLVASSQWRIIFACLLQKWTDIDWRGYTRTRSLTNRLLLALICCCSITCSGDLLHSLSIFTSFSVADISSALCPFFIGRCDWMVALSLSPFNSSDRHCVVLFCSFCLFTFSSSFSSFSAAAVAVSVSPNLKAAAAALHSPLREVTFNYLLNFTVLYAV